MSLSITSINERLLAQAIDHDIVKTVVNLSVNDGCETVNECQKCLELKTELLNKKDFVDKETYDKLCVRLSTIAKRITAYIRQYQELIGFAKHLVSDSISKWLFRQHICFIRNLEGVDLLTGSQGDNLYTLSLGNMIASSPICLLSKASKTKSWVMASSSITLESGAIIILQDRGHIETNLNNVYKLQKAHYGLKQAPPRKLKALNLVDPVILHGGESKLDEEKEGKLVESITLSCWLSKIHATAHLVVYNIGCITLCKLVTKRQEKRCNPVRKLNICLSRMLCSRLFTKALGRERIEFLINKLEHAEYDESNTYVLERFNTTAGNPVKKILLKLNLSDHRILKDGGEVISFDDADGIDSLPNQAIVDAIQLKSKVFSFMIKKGKHFSGNVTPLFDSMLVQPTKDEGDTLERQSEPQPIPSPPHLSEDQHKTQTDPSPRPLPTTHILDSIPEGSGGNHGGQSSSDRSLLGNEGGMTLQIVYDLRISLCNTAKIGGKEILEETVDAKGVWRISYMMHEDKESVEKGVSTEDPFSTAQPKVSTNKEEVSIDRPDKGTVDQNEGRSATQTALTTTTLTIFGDDETIAQVLIIMSQNKEKLKEKEKGVELKDVEETERPRPTSTRSLLTLKPLPKIDPKDKGKKMIEEEDESDTDSEDIIEAEKN
ncbi:hypothetical protein Tco_1246429 [Tanacetum coccineum]